MPPKTPAKTRKLALLALAALSALGLQEAPTPPTTTAPATTAPATTAPATTAPATTAPVTRPQTAPTTSRRNRFIPPTINPAETKRAPDMLKALAPLAAELRASVGQVIGDNGREIALATVVRTDGYLVTKASEIVAHAKLQVRLGASGITLPAEVVSVVTAHDIALLRVKAADLKPAPWAAATDLRVGQIVLGVGTDKDPLGMGVVSVGRRPTSGGMMGVLLGPTSDEDPVSGAKISVVNPGTPAAKAGILPGDIITHINDQPFEDVEELRSHLQLQSAGTEVAVTLRRGEETLVFRLTLAQRPEDGVPLPPPPTPLPGAATTNPTTNPATRAARPTPPAPNPGGRALMQNTMGGPLSGRRSNFPAIIQHDVVLQPGQQGGPLVNLDGKVIGINIARAGRVETYTVPADIIEALLPEMLAGKYPPPVTAVTTPATTNPTTRP